MPAHFRASAKLTTARLCHIFFQKRAYTFLKARIALVSLLRLRVFIGCGDDLLSGSLHANWRFKIPIKTLFLYFYVYVYKCLFPHLCPIPPFIRHPIPNQEANDALVTPMRLTALMGDGDHVPSSGSYAPYTSQEYYKRKLECLVSAPVKCCRRSGAAVGWRVRGRRSRNTRRKLGDQAAAHFMQTLQRELNTQSSVHRDIVSSRASMILSTFDTDAGEIFVAGIPKHFWLLEKLEKDKVLNGDARAAAAVCDLRQKLRGTDSGPAAYVGGGYKKNCHASSFTSDDCKRKIEIQNDY
ncbi:hypothetical protein EVAR_33523_1 [Eumeta japonica]|uniref:Uncharacterized protein n=1 Tax=Eumeta variegata TaxID=151549 RepID=A0A4C1VLX7_EUMVA|nr:hypothetical protein EVAR_33523_1 [Eumeta japonica]